MAHQRDGPALSLVRMGMGRGEGCARGVRLEDGRPSGHVLWHRMYGHGSCHDANVCRHVCRDVCSHVFRHVYKGVYRCALRHMYGHV